MPTDNNHHRRNLYSHLAEAKSDLQCLATGLEACGWYNTCVDIGRLATEIDKIERKARSFLGPAVERLPEDLSDLQPKEPKAILVEQENVDEVSGIRNTVKRIERNGHDFVSE